MVFPVIRQGGSFSPVAPPRYEHLGGERIAMDSTDQPANIPNGTDTIYMRAFGGDVYWQFNLGFASGTNSNGVTPENFIDVIGPLANLTSLNFYGTTGAIHVQYLREVA
jgi:hypothetical protein